MLEPRKSLDSERTPGVRAFLPQYVITPAFVAFMVYSSVATVSRRSEKN